MKPIQIIIIILSCLTFCQAAKSNDLPGKGNFALPSSQQPGALVSFGQNIVDKNTTQLLLTVDDLTGVDKHFIDAAPQLLYGVTEHLSVLLSTPYAVSYKTNNNHSSGLEDALAQLEYAFYSKTTNEISEQATIVTRITFPTGSVQKNPPTGSGSPSFLLGATVNRTYVDWLVFASTGEQFMTSKNGTKNGNSYLYQFGFGRNITDRNGWIFAWLTEIDGTYEQHNKVQGVIDPNSGGNIVYVTPSLWASTKHLILQFGVGYPVTQHLYGNQKRNTELYLANLGWTF